MVLGFQVGASPCKLRRSGGWRAASCPGSAGAALQVAPVRQVPRCSCASRVAAEYPVAGRFGVEGLVDVRCDKPCVAVRRFVAAEHHACVASASPLRRQAPPACRAASSPGFAGWRTAEGVSPLHVVASACLGETLHVAFVCGKVGERDLLRSLKGLYASVFDDLRFGGV